MSSSDDGQPDAITDDAWVVDVNDLTFGKKIGAGNFAKGTLGFFLTRFLLCVPCGF